MRLYFSVAVPFFQGFLHPASPSTSIASYSDEKDPIPSAPSTSTFSGHRGLDKEASRQSATASRQSSRDSTTIHENRDELLSQLTHLFHFWFSISAVQFLQCMNNMDLIMCFQVLSGYSCIIVECPARLWEVNIKCSDSPLPGIWEFSHPLPLLPTPPSAFITVHNWFHDLTWGYIQVINYDKQLQILARADQAMQQILGQNVSLSSHEKEVKSFTQYLTTIMTRISEGQKWID